MRRVSPKEIENVLRLDGEARFRRFVKNVADAEAAWGLWDDGWALYADDDGKKVFPLWPEREYAELCRAGEWQCHVAKKLPIDMLLEDLLVRLEAQEILVGVFPTPKGTRTPTLAPRELAAALREESKRYQ